MTAMTRERTQGLSFIALTTLALFFSMFGVPFTPHAELLVIALLIAVFGVPHGALDPIFAKNVLSLKTTFRWAAFVLFYLLLASVVIVFWWLSPFFFLLFFLFCSVFHFSGDLASGTSRLTRFLYGGASIVLPAALHSIQLGELFTLLIGQEGGVYLAGFLHMLSWPWLGALCLATVHTYSRDWLTALEICAASSLGLVLSPLLGFTIFFCGMHSARHIVRSQHYAGLSFAAVAKVSMLPMLALVAMVVLSWVYLPQSPLDARIIQFVFVGLAALTVPHMVLIERIRFSGWLPNSSPL
jgi:Brp/Blh family beta-carotene 15,15'-monooxygenase